MPLKFSTLILPDTIPQEDSLRQLLLYFETIFLYSPMEDIAERLPAEFQDLCHQYAPVPFGDALQNFKQLIGDMTKNRAEYYGGGLSALSAKANAVDEESVWRLVSRLSPQIAHNAQREPLLHSRLLLKLAEVRDQEEEEISRTLAAIDGKNQTMLHGLTNEDEDESSEMLGVAYLDRQQSDDTLTKRLRAWAHLFLADIRMADHWLISTTPEVLSILIDHASSELNESPNRLLSIPLPGASVMSLSPADYLRERRAWRQETSAYLAALAVGLKGAAITGTFAGGESLCEKLVVCYKKMQPWGGECHSEATLDLYLLPVSLAKIFAKIAKVSVQGSTSPTLPYGLVAVVRSTTSPFDKA